MSTERRRRATAQNGASGANGTGTEPVAFEEALGRLDETIAALEGGQVPLEDAIRLYEEGIRLAQRCQKLLDTAELRVQALRPATADDDTDNAFVLETIEIRDRE